MTLISKPLMIVSLEATLPQFSGTPIAIGSKNIIVEQANFWVNSLSDGAGLYYETVDVNGGQLELADALGSERSYARTLWDGLPPVFATSATVNLGG